ncbi:TetR/AcrR family transcriptional regulator [Azospirillum sp. CT11-132]|uniref:TetR/AcrR family transcriptional regulator n=1 Tax=Azospirillum sp. CT11-132 TaxID=3396317 RepID=UPI0039A41E75
MIEQVARQGQEDAVRHLGRSDWLSAAIGIFIEDGIDAVRITRLADALSVTRGSFYWHFKDRDELLSGIVAFWSQKNTAGLVAAISGAPSFLDGMMALFEAWIDPERFDPRLDHAMREWAHRSEPIRKSVREADETRLEALTSLFSRFGYPSPEALVRARIVYYSQLGYYTLEVSEPLADRLALLEGYYEAYTGKPLDRQAADAFRGRHLG